ncbi:hypothetical protein [Streptomyces camponoticapitis]|uniref:hypothetical protein n=1 Tax=Streptomyces camponoticapitis TaxID=1616125 RepID=UPI003570B8A9
MRFVLRRLAFQRFVRDRTSGCRGKKGRRGGWPISRDADLCKQGNVFEGLISRLRDWRGIATRFDETPESYLASLKLRSLMISTFGCAWGLTRRFRDYCSRW